MYTHTHLLKATYSNEFTQHCKLYKTKQNKHKRVTNDSVFLFLFLLFCLFFFFKCLVLLVFVIVLL